jgi:DNA-binding response OmpR family regulator
LERNFCTAKVNQSEASLASPNYCRAKEKTMKRDLILLVNGDAETARTIGSVASALQCDLRYATSSRADLHLEETLTGVTLIVFDADYGTNEASVSPRVVTCATTLPVIVLSTDDKSWLEPIFGADRTQHYLRKPVSLKELKPLVTAFLGREEKSCRCDRWGHRCEDCACHDRANDDHEIVTFIEH